MTDKGGLGALVNVANSTRIMWETDFPLVWPQVTVGQRLTLSQG